MSERRSMSDRRSFFRIDENIALEYREVSEKTTQEQEPEALYPDAVTFALYSEMKKIDNENAALLFQLKNDNRTLGEYLHNMNRKIDLLGQQLMAEHKPAALTHLTRQVNLSEGGIAFGSIKPIQKDDFIALRMTFLPSYAGVVVFAKITRCELCNAGDYQIGAKFVGARDAQLQIIGQQIMRAQMADRRQQHIQD